jgi:hypothetical protein
MYSRQEASKLKQEFWMAFGQYMQPIPSAEGERINWINYKTGEKDISFRMNADHTSASISIELKHKDPEIRQIYFEQLIQFRKLFRSTLGEEWLWEPEARDEHGRAVSTISSRQSGLNVFQKENWPALISFFKPRIIALDEFWSSVKYAFEMLR